MKTLHSIQSIYFDDKLSFGVNFVGHRTFKAQTIIKLILLKLLTLPPDIKMTYLILIILILNKW